MVLLQYITAGSVPALHYPAAKQAFVDNGNSIRKIHPQCPMKKGNRGFAKFVSIKYQKKQDRQSSYRNAGSLPNNAINVNAEIASITKLMVLRTPILKPKFRWQNQ